MKFYLYIICAILLVSCSPQKKKYIIGVAQCSSDVWRDKLNKELETSAMCYDDVEIHFASAEDNSERQIMQIDSFVKSGVDLLIVSPNQEKSVSPAIDKAYENGIPVILFDRKTVSKKYTAFIGADNYKIGKEMGKYISNILNGKGNVVEITGLYESSPAIDRDRGFRDAIRKYPEIKLVGIGNGDWTERSGRIVMDSIFTTNKNINCVFGQNDRMAIGAKKAIDSIAGNKGNRIVYAGIDALATADGGLQSVKSGRMSASFIYPTRGDLVIKLAMNIMQGKEYKRENYMDAALVTDKNANVILIQNEEIESQQERMKEINSKLDTFLMQYSNQKVYLLLFFIIILLLIVSLVVTYRMMLMKRLIGEKTAKAKLEFFTNISHELRTPLTLISGPIEQLTEDSDIKGKELTMLLMVKKNVNIMLRLVNEILDFRKIQNGKMKMQLGMFDLSTDLRLWTEMFSSVAEKKKISMSQDIEDGLVMYADEYKVERICHNLISNAIKYNKSDGSVFVSASSDDKNVTIKVRDSGIGIPKESIHHVFDRFYRVGENNQLGTGIGLAIVQSFTKLHNGTVRVDSKENEGTTFIVSLPLSQPKGKDSESIEKEELKEKLIIDDYETDDANKIINTDKITTAENTNTKQDILVVDDNEDVRNYIFSLLKDLYNVSLAKDGKEGLDKAIKEVPDLIICDVMMPVMTGTDMCKKVKEDVVTCHIPVILLTARTLEEQRAEAYECNADAYITKPFSNRIMLARIKNLLVNRIQLKNIFSSGEHNEDTTPQTIDNKFIDEFRKIINENIANSDLNVEDVSAKMGLSRVQLYRKVKSLTGSSPVELIRIIRLKKAERLLHTTESTVAEISYNVGFSSPSYFAKCFKEYFGKSPNETKL